MHVTIVNNLLPGFESVISYVGLGFVVPHTIYPAGYCDHKESLPFVGIASQKASINYTTWVSIPILKFWRGLSINIQNTPKEN